MVKVRSEESGQIPELKWDETAFAAFQRSYDRRRDIFLAYKTPKAPAVSLDVGGHVWIRFLPESGDVVGVEIEDFERVFLVKYPELAVGWEQLKPRIIKRFTRHEHTMPDYLRLLLRYVKEMLATHPPQLGLVGS